VCSNSEYTHISHPRERWVGEMDIDRDATASEYKLSSRSSTRKTWVELVIIFFQELKIK
jgi:hypothetical protein